jgi:OOP family OmpA-OmpF porin
VLRRAGITVAIAIAAFGPTAPGITLAQDPVFYSSGSIGQTRINMDALPVDAAGAAGISTDDADTAWKLNVGYRVNRLIGIEAGYVNFGDPSSTALAGGPPITTSAEARARTLAGVGTLPLAPGNSLSGKIGVYRGGNKGTATAAPAVANPGSRRTNHLFGGIDMRHDFNRSLGIQVEAALYNGGEDLNLVSVGVRYKF